MATLSVSLSLLGVLVALRAFERRGCGALALHAVSLSLFVAAVASYEVFAAVGRLVGLLHLREVGWRRARLRWALDAVAIFAAVALTRLALSIDVATPSRMQSFSAHGPTPPARSPPPGSLIGAAADPFALVDPWLAAAMVAAALPASVVSYRRLPVTSATRATLGRWLKVVAAGAALALAAWAVYVPAVDYYSPAAVGTGNRVNVLAGAGVVLLVYACARLAATLLGCLTAKRLGGSAAVAAGALAAIAAIVLCPGYLQRTAQDARTWDTSAALQRRLLADVHAALPRPPRGATVYAFDHPLTVVRSLPVLNTPLDLTSAIRWSYADRSLAGVPLGRSTQLVCGATTVHASDSGPAYAARYRRALLVDVDARRAVSIGSRSQCARAGAALPRGWRPPVSPATPPRAGTLAKPSESLGSRRG